MIKLRSGKKKQRNELNNTWYVVSNLSYMKRVMMLVLPTDWSPRNTSLYLARGDTVAIFSICFELQIGIKWRNKGIWIGSESQKILFVMENLKKREKMAEWFCLSLIYLYTERERLRDEEKPPTTTKKAKVKKKIGVLCPICPSFFNADYARTLFYFFCWNSFPAQHWKGVHYNSCVQLNLQVAMDEIKSILNY